MGLKSTQRWPELERALWSSNSGEASGACEQHVGGCCKSENIRTKQDGASRKFGTCGPKKMVTRLKSLGPIENYNLPWSMGLKSIQCCFEVERTLWSLNSGEASCACEQHVGGLASRKTAELKKIVPPESLEHVNQRRWWLYKVWAPSKIFENYNFPWGSNRHSFDPNEKEGYGGDCFGEASLYPDNMYASVEVVKHRNERRWCL